MHANNTHKRLAVLSNRCDRLLFSVQKYMYILYMY